MVSIECAKKGFKVFDLENPELEKKIAVDETKDKLSVLSFSGPFEALSRQRGLLNTLKEIAVNPKEIASRLDKEANRILESVRLLLEKGIKFDYGWMLSDLAYKDNLFFSLAFYKKYLFPIHKRIINFLNSHNMSVIFHSDGKIDNLIPYLLKAGVKALYPLDEYADMDIAELRRRYAGKLIFFD